jgi:hypothetical protein
MIADWVNRHQQAIIEYFSKATEAKKREVKYHRFLRDFQ